MSLVLEGANPQVVGKTWTAKMVHLDGIDIPIEDFLVFVQYVLTNTDIEGEDDPRLSFLKRCANATIVEGYNKGAKRILL